MRGDARIVVTMFAPRASDRLRTHARPVHDFAMITLALLAALASTFGSTSTLASSSVSTFTVDDEEVGTPVMVQLKLELEGRTLGVVGCGNVGKAVAAIAPALGLKVIVSDPPLADRGEAPPAHAEGGFLPLGALAELGDQGAIEPLDAYARGGDLPEKRQAARKTIDAITKKAGESAAVRELKERVGRLEKQVEQAGKKDPAP